MSKASDDPPVNPVAKKKASKKESVMKRFVRLITRKKKN
jgi:hypothetical protein